MSADPILDPSDPQQLNGCTYANNSSVTFSDPTGEFLGALNNFLQDTADLLSGGGSKPRGGGGGGHKGAGASGSGSGYFAGTHPNQNVFYNSRDQHQIIPTHRGFLPCGAGFHHQDGMAFWHGLLGWVGLIPVVGEPADGVNAGLYAAEGDWLNAATSAGACVPVVGSGGTATRRGVKIAEAAKGARAANQG